MSNNDLHLWLQHDDDNDMQQDVNPSRNQIIDTHKNAN